MQKVLYVLVGLMFSTLLGIATWWVNGVNADRDIVHQLQWRSLYLNGNVPAAPVKPVEPGK